MDTSKVIFGYNGRDSVVTDDNGLIYMKARKAAYMANHIYKATTNMYNIPLNVGDYEEINDWKLEHIETNDQGLKIGIYYYLREIENT